MKDGSLQLHDGMTGQAIAVWFEFFIILFSSPFSFLIIYIHENMVCGGFHQMWVLGIRLGEGGNTGYSSVTPANMVQFWPCGSCNKWLWTAGVVRRSRSLWKCVLQFWNECHTFLYIGVMFLKVDDSVFKFFSNIVQKPGRVIYWKCEHQINFKMFYSCINT